MREVEARLKLSAVDRTAKAFGDISKRLDAVDRKAKQITRTQGAMERASASSAMAISRFAAPAALAYGAARAYTRFASVERAINRIGITAGATAEQTQKSFAVIDKAAYDYATTQDKVVEGLDAMVAAGRSMDSALDFLPAVTATAQAAGAEITDIATTADALGNSFGITGDKMQGAFDILVKAGKEGKFELKDMAQYVPTLGPAFEALGYKGEAGVMKLAAALQIVRQRTGSSGEAATALQNVLQKMETEETAKKFKAFGIDLRKEMGAARKEGKDLLEVFVDLSTKALKGDLSKLPQLFGDAQVISGMRALIAGGDDMTAMFGRLSSAAGETHNDLEKVLGDSQAKIDRMAASWDTLLKAVGGGVATVANPVLDKLNSEIDEVQALQAGVDKAKIGDESRTDVMANYFDAYREVYPETSAAAALNPWSSARESGRQALSDLGRGKSQTLYDDLNRVKEGRSTARFPTAADGAAASAAYAERHAGDIDGAELRRGTPVPVARPDAAGALTGMSMQEQRAEYERGRRFAVTYEDRQRAAAWAEPGVDQGSIAPSADYLARKRARMAAINGESTSPSEAAAPVAAAADELRQAMETGGQSITTAGTTAGASLTDGGTAAAAAIAAVFGPGAAVLAEAIRSALAAGVKVSMPAMPLPRANAAPATTMPDAGKAGG